MTGFARPRPRVLLAAVVGVAAAVGLVFWRGFHWQHAVFVGAAISALVYSVGSTAERLRDLHRR